ncbi:hypothetical protein [Microbacterium xylanilyticum]
MDARPRVVTGRYGAAVRRYGPDSPEATDLRRDLAAAKISAAIDSALAASGAPLKAEHAAQLAARLKAGAR